MFGDEKKYWLLPVFSRYAQFLMLHLLKLLNNQDPQGLGGVVSFLKQDAVILTLERTSSSNLGLVGVFLVRMTLILIFFQSRGWLLLPNLPC